MGVRAPGRYVLRWTDPGGAEREKELDSEHVIGRADDADIVLADPMVSRNHARIRVSPDAVTIEDLNSANGTRVNGERVGNADLRTGDQVAIGSYSLRLMDRGAQAAEQTLVAASAEGTLVLEALIQVKDPESTQILAPVTPPRPAPAQVRGVVSDEVLSQPIISEHDLIQNGVEVKVAEFALLGGGMGSFIMASHLRNYGVAESDILVASNESQGYGRYRRLVQNSQIPDRERLRSNSDSCPGNPWGFPGYAPREIFREIGRGNLKVAWDQLWKIFGEPTLAPTFTPVTGDVWSEMDREARRIGYDNMLVMGRLRAIRKTREGRLLAVVSQSEGSNRKHVAVAAKFLHLCPGYPSLQFLPDLAEFREKYNDRTRVINAYEKHDHVYEDLLKNGGTVILRGRGIVASRIIQKLWESRATNKSIQVVHLHRTRLTQGAKFGFSRRKVSDDFEFQPFNWPKSCWTGQGRYQLEAASDDERKRLLSIWGGTTTADRPDWERMVREGLRDGWYRAEYGIVEDARLNDRGRVVTRIKNSLAGGGRLELEADYVIDCTGLVAAPERSPLLADLLATYNLRKNPLGRFHVSNDFEIEGLRHENARVYASGAITLGGPFAAVDSFLGLQYSILRIIRHAHGQGARGIHNFWLNPFYSFNQWFKWLRGAKP
ncbi:MAG: FHA domain-containing protein [Dehalococcoidia bacterium]|nr:FHA domain-containing protein [Dehalococcoidia bacterium]